MFLKQTNNKDYLNNVFSKAVSQRGNLTLI